MNDKIKEFIIQCTDIVEIDNPDTGITHHREFFDKEKFAKLIVQDCADFVRETYDHEHAESIAWYMEVEYGLHGDYA